MDPIIVPNDDPRQGQLSEIKQVSVGTDDDVAAVNALLADGWRLMHISSTGDRTVYVLGKPVQQSKRSTGFVA